MRSLLIGLVLATLGSVAAAQDETPVVRFSVLPAVRGHDGDTYIRASTSVLASLTYTGETPVENCWIADEITNYANANNGFDRTSLVWFTHTQTDASGSIIAPANAWFDMAPGQTRHFTLRAESDLCGYWNCIVRPRLDCAGPDGTRTGNSADRYYSRGLPVESFLFNIGPRPMADVIPIMVTASGDGYLRFPRTGGVAAASVAAVNIGVDSEVTVVATATGGMAADICETNSNGQCLSPRDRSVTVQMNRDEIHLFSVRVRDIADYSLPPSPAQHRLNVRFVERNVTGLVSGIRLSGDTSVALDEPIATSSPPNIAGVWQLSRCLSGPRTQGEYYPGEDTSGDRLLIGSNGLAISISQISEVNFCNSYGAIQFIRFDTVAIPSDTGVFGLELMFAARDWFETDWYIVPSAGNPRIDVRSDAGGDVLSFSSELLTDPYFDDDGAEITGRREFNTAYASTPAGRYRLEYEINGAPVAATIVVADDLSFTTAEALNCSFAGRMERDAAIGGPSLYQITMTVSGCSAPMFTHNGQYEGLVLVEQTELGLALNGAAYRESAARERFLFPIRTVRID